MNEFSPFIHILFTFYSIFHILGGLRIGWHDSLPPQDGQHLRASRNGVAPIITFLSVVPLAEYKQRFEGDIARVVNVAFWADDCMLRAVTFTASLLRDHHIDKQARGQGSSLLHCLCALDDRPHPESIFSFTISPLASCAQCMQLCSVRFRQLLEGVTVVQRWTKVPEQQTRTRHCSRSLDHPVQQTPMLR
jgi:hypothetical protein